MITEHRVSRRQACKAVRISSSPQRYKKKKGKVEPLIVLLQDLVERYPAIGFWQCYFRIRRMGHQWNRKRLYPVYTVLKLNIRRRRKKRLPIRILKRLQLFVIRPTNSVARRIKSPVSGVKRVGKPMELSTKKSSQKSYRR